jgi:predicted nucleic acid-binding protein
MDLEKIFLTTGDRHALSQSKKEQIQKIMNFNSFDDIFILRTKYINSLCSLLQYKYIDILKKATKNRFREFGYFVPRNSFKNYYTDEQLKQIKINTYKKLFNYYNMTLVPMLQKASEKVAIISIKNFKFKLLKDKTYMIK